MVVGQLSVPDVLLLLTCIKIGKEPTLLAVGTGVFFFFFAFFLLFYGDEGGGDYISFLSPSLLGTVRIAWKGMKHKSSYQQQLTNNYCFISEKFVKPRIDGPKFCHRYKVSKNVQCEKLNPADNVNRTCFLNSHRVITKTSIRHQTLILRSRIEFNFFFLF